MSSCMHVHCIIIKWLFKQIYLIRNLPECRVLWSCDGTRRRRRRWKKDRRCQGNKNERFENQCGGGNRQLGFHFWRFGRLRRRLVRVPVTSSPPQNLYLCLLRWPPPLFLPTTTFNNQNQIEIKYKIIWEETLFTKLKRDWFKYLFVGENGEIRWSIFIIFWRPKDDMV